MVKHHDQKQHGEEKFSFSMQLIVYCPKLSGQELRAGAGADAVEGAAHWFSPWCAQPLSFAPRTTSHGELGTSRQS